MFDMDKETTEGFAKVTEAAAEAVETGATKAYEAVEGGVTKTYNAIEKGVVGAYQAVENAVVGTFNRMTDAIVGKVLTKEGETVEEAKARMAKEQADREEANRQRMAQHTAMAEASLEKSRQLGEASLAVARKTAKREE